MTDIRAALHGKRLTANGTNVDHSSPSLTPHLQLHVVTYQEQIRLLGPSNVLISKGLIDGISLWIEGPLQNTLATNLTSFVMDVRGRVPQSMQVYTGAYIIHSHTGWLPPKPVMSILNQSIELYDANVVQGFYFFSGCFLSKMNASLWAAYNLTATLDKVYLPWMGYGEVTAVDATTRKPIPSALVIVTYNGTITNVTRGNTACVSKPRHGMKVNCTDASLSRGRGGDSIAVHLGVFWLTHSEAMPAKEQCERVAAMQKMLPWMRQGRTC